MMRENSTKERGAMQGSDWDEDEEAIARIIDPHAWHTLDQFHREGWDQDVWGIVKSKLEPSIKKAAQIIELGFCRS